MKKSKAVPATLVCAVAAMTIAGCHRESQLRRCVDNTGKVLPDSYCEEMHRHRSSFSHYGYPHFVYGGYGGHTPGSQARGFVNTPNPGADVVTGSGRVISRGGFGGRGGGGFGFGG